MDTTVCITWPMPTSPTSFSTHPIPGYLGSNQRRLAFHSSPGSLSLKCLSVLITRCSPLPRNVLISRMFLLLGCLLFITSVPEPSLTTLTDTASTTVVEATGCAQYSSRSWAHGYTTLPNLPCTQLMAICLSCQRNVNETLYVTASLAHKTVPSKSFCLLDTVDNQALGHGGTTRW